MLDDFNKRQRVIDLDEEAEEEVVEEKAPEETGSAFDTPQYRRVMQACKERSEIPTMAWTPDEEPTITLSDNAKNEAYKYTKFWDGLPEVVSSKDHPHGYVDLFRKLNPVDAKTGHPKKVKDDE